jgi:protein-arginine kinase activator protein McsA
MRWPWKRRFLTKDPGPWRWVLICTHCQKKDFMGTHRPVTENMVINVYPCESCGHTRARVSVGRRIEWPDGSGGSIYLRDDLQQVPHKRNASKAKARTR